MDLSPNVLFFPLPMVLHESLHLESCTAHCVYSYPPKYLSLGHLCGLSLKDWGLGKCTRRDSGFGLQGSWPLRRGKFGKEEMSGWNPPNYRIAQGSMSKISQSKRLWCTLPGILCGTERHMPPAAGSPVAQSPQPQWHSLLSLEQLKAEESCLK